MSGLGRHEELDVRCRSEVDPTTDHCINIKDIDRAVRSTAIPAIAAACMSGPSQHPATVLQGALAALERERLGSVVIDAVRSQLSPYSSFEMALQAPAVPIARHF